MSAQPRINAHPTALPTSKTPIRDNKRPTRRRSFLQSTLQKPCFLASSLFVSTIYYFVAKYTTTLAENGENLISAQPRSLTFAHFVLLFYFAQESDKLKDDDLYKFLADLKRPSSVLKRLKCIPGNFLLHINAF